MKDRAQSAAQSSHVAETLQPVVDPQEKIEKAVFHDWVRKLAHVTEFGVLGLFVVGFAISLGLLLKKNFVSMPLLLVLSVAVGDEYIQYFADRGSLVTDIVLDFIGAMIGMGGGWLLYLGINFLTRHIKMRKEQVDG